MRYLYYIGGIIVLFSILAAYGVFKTKVEISKPAVVINDRIISESELETRIKLKPYYMNRNEYIDSLIDEQLLIQEALNKEIHKEESFRQSVQQYYEQSLIKILVDRKLSSLKTSVSDNEIQKYKILSASRLIISKFGYKSLNEAQNSVSQTPQKIDADFVDLSDGLKFTLLNLKKGEMSPPVESGMGVLSYRIDQIIPLEAPKRVDTDDEQIRNFIAGYKQEQLMADWIRELKANAEIWREK
ncbi:hypothetical protein [Desulfobacter postgatei]|uniref:peptidylprolyl isomerase n=1 Tax=Desulfobacter postgatei TaxID=2293 RepID=UPI00259B434A|nr:hypothetical protein [uncultured Desulfobacter sp.]